MEMFRQVNYRRKCGEITLINNRSIYFTCDFCKIEMQDIKKFLGHILKVHMAKGDHKKWTSCEGSDQLSDLYLESDECETRLLEDAVVTKNEPISDNETEGETRFSNDCDYSKNEDETYDCYEDFEIKEDSNNEFMDDFEELLLMDNDEQNFNTSTNRVSNDDYSEAKENLEISPVTQEIHNDSNEIGLEIEVLPLPEGSAIVDTLPEKADDDCPPGEKLLAEHITDTQCSICLKVLKNKSVLRAHLQRHVDTKEKPFICEYCSARFGHKSGLNIHIKRHLGIKPHHCTYCEKKFSTTTELRLHTYSHTGAKQFKCKYCDLRFARRDHLNFHNRRHFNDRRYECKMCGKKFYDLQTLRLHHNTHTGERRFKCDVCESAFNSKKSLKEHSKIHSDKKSYSCKICRKSYAQYAGLYSHMKVHNTVPKSFKLG